MKLRRTAAKAIIIQNDCLLVLKIQEQAGTYYILPGGGQHHEENLGWPAQSIDVCERKVRHEELHQNKAGNHCNQAAVDFRCNADDYRNQEQY